MMRKLWQPLAMVLALNLMISTPCFAEDVIVGNVQIDKEQLKAVVQQILRENPKLVYDAYHAWKAEQQKRNEARAIDRSFNRRITDTVESWHPSKGPEKATVTLIMYMDFQ